MKKHRRGSRQYHVSRKNNGLQPINKRLKEQLIVTAMKKDGHIGLTKRTKQLNKRILQKENNQTDSKVLLLSRSAPPAAVAGAAASALQSKNIRSLPINCPFYRKFLTEPGIFSPPPTPPYVPFGIRRFSFLSHTVSTLLLFII